MLNKNSCEQGVVEANAGRGRTIRYLLGVTLLVMLATVTLCWLSFEGTPWYVQVSACMFAATAFIYPFQAVLDHLIAQRCEQPSIAVLELQEALSSEWRTLVLIPALLYSTDHIDRLAEQLARCAKVNLSRQITFGILSDFTDHAARTREDDEVLLSHLSGMIESLNRQYGDQCAGFVALHRARSWSNDQQCWMGLERKRGKLEQLNNMIVTQDVGAFPFRFGRTATLAETRFVICLDSDTVLPPGQAMAMIAVIAHPSNSPEICNATGMLKKGHAVMQPRICATRTLTAGSWIERMNRDMLGCHDGSTRVHDLFQLYYGESCFFGKGIYDVAAMHQLLNGKLSGEEILSHDVMESGFGACAVVPAAYLEEPSENNVLSEMRRRHRWIRGDWQNLIWVLRSLIGGAHQLSLPGTLKVVDNARRSMMPPALFGAVIWLVFAAVHPLPGLCFTVLIFLLPSIVIACEGAREGIRGWAAHLAAAATSARIRRQLVLLFLLPSEATVNADAIGRAIYRMCLSNRRRLDWTASDRPLTDRLRLRHYYSALYAGPLVGLGLVVASCYIKLGAPLVTALLGSVWGLGPGLAYLAGKPSR